MALEGHGMFVAKIQETLMNQIFSTAFDYWVTKVNNGICMVVIKKGR